MGATTFQAYQKWAHREKQEVVTDLLPEGAKLHWIGPRRDASQDRVFLYFHGDSGLSHFFLFLQFLINRQTLLAGGGYSLPARPEYFPFLSTLQKDVAASLGDVGVAVLQYCELSLSVARAHRSTPHLCAAPLMDALYQL